MARVCPAKRVIVEECWCARHKTQDPEENERRRLIGEAPFEWRGGEALHVFLGNKATGELISLCNLRHAVPEDELRKIRHVPTVQCDQCRRTLRSRTPNIRLARWFQERRKQRADALLRKTNPGVR